MQRLLDKTGTLTFGTPQIQEVLTTNGFAARQIVGTASIAERKSEHPMAKAIVARAAELGVAAADPDEFSCTPGRGVSVRYQGEEILVGSRAFLIDSSVRLSASDLPDSNGASEVYLARAGKQWEASVSLMYFVPKQELR